MYTLDTCKSRRWYMKAHHLAWLQSHPRRDLDWLTQALSAGFDVHHIDGVHENNHPENLVLIENTDHMRLHGLPLLKVPTRTSWDHHQQRAKIGEEAYRLRVEENLSWDAVGERLGYPTPSNGSRALNVAAKYARYYKKPWPLGHTKTCDCRKCKFDRRMKEQMK